MKSHKNSPFCLMIKMLCACCCSAKKNVSERHVGGRVGRGSVFKSQKTIKLHVSPVAGRKRDESSLSSIYAAVHAFSCYFSLTVNLIL